MPKSDPTIGMLQETGDRGVPALVKDSDGNYSILEKSSNGSLNVNLSDIFLALKQIINLLSRNTIIDPVNNQIRTIFTATSSLNVVNTVSSVTSIAGFGLNPGSMLTWERTNWATNIRPNIT